VFVDESKTKGYFVAAAAVLPNDAGTADKALRKLVRPGQERIHFKSEDAGSKKKLLSQMLQLPVLVNLYIVKGRNDKEARTLCLNALVQDLVAARVSKLLIERDESLEQADRRTIATALRVVGYQLAYDHVGPKEHAVLWVSDAVAWCHQAGGDWVRRAAPLVGAVRHLG
jgi:hypothetical protein